jgi:Uma2 family endonuclease
VVPRGDGIHVHPRTALLIVEVADTSLETDTGTKAQLYAESGVPEYWVVNLRHWIVEVHAEPVAGRYTRMTPYRRGERIRLLKLSEVEIAVEEFLPEPPATGGDRG